ncbi:MAG TPA: alpha/beta hydrolase [Acidimicrobiia bacterium]
MGSEPGFVLVHGAGLGAWIWDPLIARLSRPALAIDLPGRGSRPAPRRSVGMSAAIEAVAAEARAWGDRPLVLVGHSLGGVVALGAAAELGPRVQRVVLVGGGAVPSGMSYFAALPTRDRWALKLAAALRIPAPAAAVRRVLCHDLDDDTAELVVERTALPEPWRMYGEKVHWDALSRSVPMTYVKLLQDRAVSPALQERFASYLRRPDVLTIDSGHLPMLGSRLPTLATALEPA